MVLHFLTRNANPLGSSILHLPQSGNWTLVLSTWYFGPVWNRKAYEGDILFYLAFLSFFASTWSETRRAMRIAV